MDRGEGCDAQMEIPCQEPRTLVEFKQRRLSPPSALILHPVESPHIHHTYPISRFVP